MWSLRKQASLLPMGVTQAPQQSSPPSQVPLFSLRAVVTHLKNTLLSRVKRNFQNLNRRTERLQSKGSSSQPLIQRQHDAETQGGGTQFDSKSCAVNGTSWTNRVKQRPWRPSATARVSPDVIIRHRAALGHTLSHPHPRAGERSLAPHLSRAHPPPRSSR